MNVRLLSENHLQGYSEWDTERRSHNIGLKDTDTVVRAWSTYDGDYLKFKNTIVDYIMVFKRSNKNHYVVVFQDKIYAHEYPTAQELDDNLELKHSVLI